LLIAGWLEASGGNLDLATTDIERAMELDTGVISVGQLHLSFVRSQQGRAADALVLLDLCRPEFERRGLAWEAGASWVLTAWAEIASGRLSQARVACENALQLIEPLGDNWGRIHAEAMLGELAQAEHRFREATAHLGRAARAAHELGFEAAEAHHLTNLGRAQQQLGDPAAAAATLDHAIEVATATADLRTAALARVRLARVLRATGGHERARVEVDAARRWYAVAGAGEGQPLADYLAAALDIDDEVAGAEQRLGEVLAAARQSDNVEIEILALETAARVDAERGQVDQALQALREADRLLPVVAHLMIDSDHADRDRALALVQ
jgi:tetratricopeptide (TPR) repeat protein